MTSANEQIESIVTKLEEKGLPAAPVEESLALAASHPEAILDLAIAVMERFPDGGTFLDGAFSFLPDALWPSLVERAMEMREQSAEENEAADSVIAYASLQCPEALHPHLTRIFNIQPNSGSYYEQYPWRKSAALHFDYLRNIVENSTSPDERWRAWVAMLQTRHPSVLEYAISKAEDLSLPDHFGSREEWLLSHLRLVGFDIQGGSLNRTCGSALYHLQFPDSYFDEQSRPPWLAQVHPSWNLPSREQTVRFGGSSENSCLRCRGTLHRLVVLEPIPTSLEITGLPRLELAVCLSCLGWEEMQLFYRHDQLEHPSHAFYDGPTAEPQFPVGPLKQAEAALAETPQRWYWQDWALSNSRENLNRIGGEPCWVQDADYPNCPACHRTMKFLMQLDSDLPTEDGGEWLWGSGGIGYGFWCDNCKVSGFLWQCT